MYFFGCRESSFFNHLRGYDRNDFFDVSENWDKYNLICNFSQRIESNDMLVSLVDDFLNKNIFVLNAYNNDLDAINFSELIGSERQRHPQMICHSNHFISLCNDKTRTHNLAHYNGILTSLYSGYQDGYVLKPRIGATGYGMKYYKTRSEVDKHTLLDECIQIEPFVSGLEVSFNVFIFCGKILYLPVIQKGETDKALSHPTTKIRTLYSNCNLYNIMKESIKKFISLFDLEEVKGFVEFEFIVNDANAFLLEVNPRISRTAIPAALSVGEEFIDILNSFVQFKSHQREDYQMEALFNVTEFPVREKPEIINKKDFFYPYRERQSRELMLAGRYISVSENC